MPYQDDFRNFFNLKFTRTQYDFNISTVFTCICEISHSRGNQTIYYKPHRPESDTFCKEENLCIFEKFRGPQISDCKWPRAGRT